MKKIIWIGIAGSAGAILRTLIGYLMPSNEGFPFETLIVNLFGTFILGYLLTVMGQKINKDILDIWTVGFLGSFTTFSAFTLETVNLFESDQLLLAIAYVFLSIVGGLGAGQIGIYLGRKKVGK